jgi:endonuclease/exonuclease/phosphatase family metal-dependent hydrolase
VVNDQDWLYLRFNTTVEVQPDEGQNIVLALDTDMNGATGQSVAGIGAELVWNLGQRSGTFYGTGSAQSVDHATIGLVIGPTVSGTDFELCLDRHALPEGVALFPGNELRLVVFDDDSGDQISLISPGYTFDPTSQPVPSLGLGRDGDSHVRIAGYNVQNDGLFDGGSREAAQQRIFNAIDPDIWVICEVWDHDASEVASQIETLLPSGPGESWSAVKRDAGNVVVSRFPILNSWEIYPGNRLTAVLVDLRPIYDSDLLVIANHWSCCTADASRQNQADALIAFIRDAQTPGGVIDLATDTPIVATGDFNLVGWRAQLETISAGDIADNGSWGVDSPPDWDGSEFDEANPRHPDARFAHTWRNDASSFYPGKLDWMFFTGSVMTLQNHFVLETRTMTASSLSLSGLQADDTIVASDHGPVVADFSVGSTALAVGDERDNHLGPTLLPNVPNPFERATTIRFRLDEASVVDLAVFDIAGRRVRTLLHDTVGAGDHSVVWDGLDGMGRQAASGIYFCRFAAGRTVGTRRMMLVR